MSDSRPALSGPLLLRAAGAAVLLDLGTGVGGELPQVVHWGSDPGSLNQDELAQLVVDVTPGVSNNALDEPTRFSVLPGQSEGWQGRPGLAGHRDGANAFTRFRVTGSTLNPVDGDGTEFVVTAADEQA